MASVKLTGLGHLLPLEDPAMVTEVIRRIAYAPLPRDAQPALIQ